VTRKSEIYADGNHQRGSTRVVPMYACVPLPTLAIELIPLGSRRLPCEASVDADDGEISAGLASPPARD
jgi:hypothetical protein